MSITNAFTLYAANIDSNLIDQISDFSVSTGLNLFIQTVDGGVDPTFSAIKSLIPKIKFTTTGISSALAVAGMNAANINSSANFFFQKLASGGTRESGAAHLKLATTKGMIFPRSLTAGHDVPAELTYEVICLADGGGAPVVVTKNQELTGTPNVDELYVAGPVVLNGTTVNGVKSINIDFGIKETVIGSDGEAYPSFSGIMSREPKITIDVHDLELMESFGIDGIPQGETDSVIYLRKLQKGGTRVADATEEHISFTIDEAHIGIGDTDAKPGEPAMLKIEITPIFDGTNDILLINTATAIS